METHKFNTKPEMDGKYYNLWSTDNERTEANDEVVIKTVYDPSPVGYSLPASNAFTGFTTTGQASGNPNEFNIQGSFHKGWLLYLQPNKQGSTSFFYGCGARHNNLGKLNSISTNGYYWMANHYSIRSSRNLNFSAVNINTQDNSNRSSGFSVRSAEEKEWRCVVEICNVLTSATLHPPHARRGSPPFMMSWMTQSHSATPYNTQKD